MFIGLNLGLTQSSRAGNSIESQIAALFEGKPGLRVDRPSNFANLYQDSAGATPVTAYEQVVGLALDTAQGAIRGPELAGTLTTASFSGANYTFTDLGDRIRITRNAVNPGTYSDARASSFAIVASKTYEAQFVILATGPNNNCLSSINNGGGTAFTDNLYTAGYSVRRAIGKATGVGTGTLLLFAATARGANPAASLEGDWVELSKDFSVRELLGNHLQQATTTARPKVQTSSGASYLTFDGVDDGLATATFTAGTLTSNMDCFVVVKRNAATNAAIAFPSTGGSSYLGLAASGSGTAANSGVGTPTYLVNGVAVPGGTTTTQGQLHTALPIGAWNVLEVRNADLSAWTAFGVGNYVGNLLNGQIEGVYLRQAMTTAERNTLRTYAGAQVGLVL